MSYSDRTQIGEGDGYFKTTQWTQIISARNGDEADKKLAEGEILSQYWKPVYCYIRRKGVSNEQAKDITQGFFCEIVLGRELLRKADREKGRFRNLLLTSLNHYVAYLFRAQNAAKRKPAGKLLSLAGMQDGSFPEPADEASPEQAFNYAWASDLLEDVLAEVKNECLEKKQEVYWRIFEARFLKPILEGTEPVSQEELCREFDISDEKKVSNMAVTVKRRFAAIMRKKVRPWVASEDDADQEIQDIIKILSAGNAAGPEK